MLPASKSLRPAPYINNRVRTFIVLLYQAGGLPGRGGQLPVWPGPGPRAFCPPRPRPFHQAGCNFYISYWGLKNFCVAAVIALSFLYLSHVTISPTDIFQLFFHALSLAFLFLTFINCLLFPFFLWNNTFLYIFSRATASLFKDSWNWSFRIVLGNFFLVLL